MPTRSEALPEPNRPGKPFPEGVMLGLAAVLGAVIVLAVVLGVGQARSGPGEDATETAADRRSTAPDAGTPVPPNGGDASPSDPSSDEDQGLADGDPEPGSEGSDPAPDETAPTVPDVEPLACPAGVEAVICDAAAFVQRSRGRQFKTFPDVEILPDGEFDAALLDDYEEYRADLDVDDVTLTALGLLDPDVSLSDAFRDALEVGVVGFYDPETGRLVVRGGELGLYAQLVLVHELVHAFDDQWFDLDRDDFVDGEAEYGFSAVVEGNASRVENRWRSELSGTDQTRLAQEELSALSPEDLQRYLTLPPVLLELQMSPYLDGAAYVRDLATDGGEALIDEKLIAPPTTSEEVLHPGTDRGVDPEVPVPVPPAGGPVVDEGRLGELLVRIWLGRLAASGWGGDRYVTWTSGGQECITVDLIGDSDAETVELDAGADAWADLDPGQRSVEPVTVDGRQAVRVTGCA